MIGRQEVRPAVRLEGARPLTTDALLDVPEHRMPEAAANKAAPIATDVTMPNPTWSTTQLPTNDTSTISPNPQALASARTRGSCAADAVVMIWRR